MPHSIALKKRETGAFQEKSSSESDFLAKPFAPFKRKLYLCTAFRLHKDSEQAAQMAESVDALVSNTSGATRAGSTPALGTLKSKADTLHGVSAFFCIVGESRRMNLRQKL